MENIYYTRDFYKNFIQNLYYEQGDGEVSVFFKDDTKSDYKIINDLMIVTVIDLSTLFKDRWGKAIEMIDKLSKIKHPNLVTIYKYWYIPD